MPSGKRNPGYPEILRKSRGASAAILATLLLGACSPGAGFERILGRLDAEVDDPARLNRLLDAGARRARSSSDWIRLLARAFRAAERTSNPALAADIADRARKAYPTYEDIALAACRAYLDAGRPGDALVLFPLPLDPGFRPSWFAEAYLECSRIPGGGVPRPGEEDSLLLVAATAGRGEPAIDAALLRMGAGDRAGAAACLRRAVELGAAPDPDLAWDAGALDSLLSDSRRAASGRDLEQKADAALLLGEREWAREYLMELVLADPGYSWKVYASLASLEEDPARAEYWYEGMAAAFPSDPDALRARAAYLVRTGREEAALAILGARGEEIPDPRTAALAAEIRLRGAPGEVRAARALELADAFPDDPYLQAWSLGILAAAERFSRAAEAYRRLKARGVDLGDPWYFEALSLILEGRAADAVEFIEEAGPESEGPDAPFALGVLYSETGNRGLAAERFRIAASRARDPEDRARALTEEGKELAALGDRQGARTAWEAALEAKPDYAEALRMAGSR